MKLRQLIARGLVRLAVELDVGTVEVRGWAIYQIVRAAAFREALDSGKCPVCNVTQKPGPTWPGQRLHIESQLPGPPVTRTIDGREYVVRPDGTYGEPQHDPSLSEAS